MLYLKQTIQEAVAVANVESTLSFHSGIQFIGCFLRSLYSPWQGLYLYLAICHSPFLVVNYMIMNLNFYLFLQFSLELQKEKKSKKSKKSKKLKASAEIAAPTFSAVADGDASVAANKAGGISVSIPSFGGGASEPSIGGQLSGPSIGGGIGGDLSTEGGIGVSAPDASIQAPEGSFKIPDMNGDVDVSGGAGIGLSGPEIPDMEIPDMEMPDMEMPSLNAVSISFIFQVNCIIKER